MKISTKIKDLIGGCQIDSDIVPSSQKRYERLLNEKKVFHFLRTFIYFSQTTLWFSLANPQIVCLFIGKILVAP